ncbi:hypothetical protein [Mycobacterium marseillense]|uniref:hypothetical protein n=1 Tax=Mycobacterium marseillense TaxID=701042 RepID=UPI00119FCC24|nr:hypothetical protein [Mycobacterium marseillense]
MTSNTHKCYHLDVLVHNAGAMWMSKGATVAGFETHFGTNVLGHYLLRSLRSIRCPTPRPRVVTLSSNAHKGYTFNFDDVQWQKSYSKVGTYRSSKLSWPT